MTEPIQWTDEQMKANWDAHVAGVQLFPIEHVERFISQQYMKFEGCDADHRRALEIALHPYKMRLLSELGIDYDAHKPRRCAHRQARSAHA